MKTFSKLLSEVAQPKAEDEINFKAKHEIEKFDHPHAKDDQFTGGTKKAKNRKADYDKGEDEDVYEAMDPVGKEDDDIDNDGDVDSSDKYLHRRRKAISKAMKKEETEQIDEISKKTLGSYVKKAADSLGKSSSRGGYEFGSGDMKAADKEYDTADKRNKGIKRATDRLTKENVEEERKISPGLRALIDIGNKKAAATAKEVPASTEKAFAAMAAKRKQKMNKEEVELDEANKNIIPDRELNNLVKSKKAVFWKSSGFDKSSNDKFFYIPILDKNKKMLGVYKANANDSDQEYEYLDSMLKDVREEAEQIDEISKKTLGSYVKKASYDAASNAAKFGAGETDKKGGSAFVKAHQRLRGIAKATDRLTKEEVEQLDELSPNKLHAYIKSASKDLAKRSRMSGYDDKRGNYADGDKNRKKANKRLAGITGASGRLADKANMAEDAWEEIPMMSRQLQFIMYAAQEIMSYLNDCDDMCVDPEEWFQNKLAHVHGQMTTLHAYIEGDRRTMGMYGEEVELDEAAPKMKSDFIKTQREKDKAHADAMGRHVKSGRKKTMTSTQRSLASMRKEEVELDEVTRSAVLRPVKYTDARGVTRTRMTTTKPIQHDAHGQEKIRESLEEAVKPGKLKLDDGSSITVSKKDADLLNQMFNDLNAKNRKKMQDTMMSDKEGFNEIVGFAREAL